VALIPLHTRPDFRDIIRRGGLRTAELRAQRPVWQKSFYATLQAMRRWSPQSPLLSKDRAGALEAYKLGYERGYQAGAGYKRS